MFFRSRGLVFPFRSGFRQRKTSACSFGDFRLRGINLCEGRRLRLFLTRLHGFLGGTLRWNHFDRNFRKNFPVRTDRRANGRVTVYAASLYPNMLALQVESPRTRRAKQPNHFGTWVGGSVTPRGVSCRSRSAVVHGDLGKLDWGGRGSEGGPLGDGGPPEGGGVFFFAGGAGSSPG